MVERTQVYARNVQVNGRTYAVRPPTLGDWQAAMAAGLRAGPRPEMDAAALLELCLLPCAMGPDGRLSLAELRELPVTAGDELLAAALEMLEGERARLEIEREDRPDGVTLRASGLQFRLRPWTFGERNRSLATCFYLVDGEPRIDLIAFEQAMICTCVTVGSDGSVRYLTPAEVAGWPVPLGEAILQVLDELNGLDPEREGVLRVCVEQGLPHPDLTLLHLCRTFGWTPSVVEELEARQAERLLAAMRALGAPPAAPGGTAPAVEGEEVTRIVVAD